MVDAPKCTFVLLRHGQSKANVQKIIVSSAENGILDDYGLSDQGRQEAKQAAEQIMAEYGPSIHVIASDFSRTQETAAIVAARAGSDVATDIRLRERFFGEFELTCSDNYDLVWQQDLISSEHTEFGVESVNSVAKRVQAVLQEQRAHAGTVVLVSHGDTLQILQTVMQGMEPRLHRSVPHLPTCVPRKIQ